MKSNRMPSAKTKKSVSKKVTKPKKEISINAGGKDQLVRLAKFISGEATLVKKEEELKKLKKSALLKQRNALNRRIESGDLSIREDEVLTDAELEAIGFKSQPVVQKITLYEWEAPIRVSFPFDKKAFLGIVALSLAFILYLAILGHYGLMFAIAALLFFIYVAGTTEPAYTKHIITSQGIDTFDTLYQWHLLKEFWFSKKNGQVMLTVGTKLRVPGALIFILDESQVGALFMLLQEKLVYKEVKSPSWMFKTTYGEYIPIEKI